MIRNKIIAGAFVLGSSVLLLLTGCYKDKTVVSDTGAEVTKTVSFAGDLIPIFSKNCSLSGCHVAGSKAPDLTSANAYNSLKIGNYFNTGNPAGSTIMLWLTGKKTTQMPVGGMNKDINAMVLAWIKQGAKNN